MSLLCLYRLLAAARHLLDCSFFIPWRLIDPLLPLSFYPSRLYPSCQSFTQEPELAAEKDAGVKAEGAAEGADADPTKKAATKKAAKPALPEEWYEAHFEVRRIYSSASSKEPCTRPVAGAG